MRPLLEPVLPSPYFNYLLLVLEISWFALPFAFPSLFQKAGIAYPVHRNSPSHLDLRGERHLLSVYAGLQDASYGTIKGTLTLTPHRIHFTPDKFIPREIVTLDRKYISDITQTDQSLLIRYTLALRETTQWEFILWNGTQEVHDLLTTENPSY